MQTSRDSLKDELTRQRLILLREMPERVLLTTLAFALCTIFVDPLAVLVVWALHMAVEAVGPWLQSADRMLRSAGTYAQGIAQSVLVEATYIMGAGLVWQVDSLYSKPFAVGMATLTLMHLATVRGIHLPIGIAGLAGAAGAALTTNSLYWVSRGDFTGLALSTAACFAALAYTLTAMMSNNRLHASMAHQEAVARAAVEAKTMFMAQMSHELRTPLNALIGMGQAELADATARRADSLSQGRLQTLVDAARMLSVILDDVTDMNAVDHGRLPLRPRTVRLQTELNATFANFRERAERLAIPFELHTEGATPDHVRIDPIRLRQCLGNLLSNAMRHAPGGAIRAVCRAKPCGEAAGCLEFDVSDNGPGVPDAQREVIFEAFHKGRAAAPGTGLGLAIARSLARLMGGDLRLMPSDQGAFFRLTVAYELASETETSADIAPDLTGRTVLVVDDIATNRLVAATYLRQMGARVIEAATGEAGLVILAAEEVDLVLLDMNMPGIDGFETARRARMMGGRVATLPIVAMTADVMAEQVEAIYHAGLDGHLPKPLLPEALAAEMARRL